MHHDGVKFKWWLTLGLVLWCVCLCWFDFVSRAAGALCRRRRRRRTPTTTTPTVGPIQRPIGGRRAGSGRRGV